MYFFLMNRLPEGEEVFCRIAVNTGESLKTSILRLYYLRSLIITSYQTALMQPGRLMNAKQILVN